VWQWWVAYNLQKRFVPRSVAIAKTFLVVSPVVLAAGVLAVAWSTLKYNASEDALTMFIRAGVSSLMWFLYFKWSLRVKNTYLQGVPKAVHET
jgi:hypothetical protein